MASNFQASVPLLIIDFVIYVGYLPRVRTRWLKSSFFCVLQTRKKRNTTRPMSSHLDRTSLAMVNKGLIVWLSGKFVLRDLAGNPERARQRHLARWLRSGSQSQSRVWLTSPDHRASRLIRLDISLFFLRVYGLRFLLGP